MTYYFTVGTTQKSSINSGGCRCCCCTQIARFSLSIRCVCFQLKELECTNQSRLFYSLDTIASSPQQLIFSSASLSLSGERLTSKSGSRVDSDDDRSRYRESLDSGCSGDSAPHFESESLNDLHKRCKLNEGIEEEEEVFEINVLDDLDLDEIEKDWLTAGIVWNVTGVPILFPICISV